jgi:hypothetical protein
MLGHIANPERRGHVCCSVVVDPVKYWCLCVGQCELGHIPRQDVVDAQSRGR